MNKKIKIILLLISLSICLGLMSNTYSRYVASTVGDITAPFSKWQILVDNIDITSNTNSTISIVPTIEEHDHIASNTIAPSSKGYFDINVDPTNVDVSFSYSINLALENETMPDLIITKYAILPEDYIDGDTLNLIHLEDNIITDQMLYDKNNADFKFSTFNIRVFFEWYEGDNELMDDEADTNVATLAMTNDELFTIDAHISFEQIIN